jgi:CDP-diacylglycerol--glycerol-3-phosphate 3-phosphatidyltransferase
LGRILDPLADKMIVCGTFVFLAAESQSRVGAWMAVVILVRELLVTALRSHAEGQSIDFSARMAGKWKMVVQCLAAGLAIYRLTYLETASEAMTWTTTPPPWLDGMLDALLWGAVVITIYSGVGYVRAAVRLLQAPDGSTP